MSSKATFCQSTVLVSYIILMILNHKNMTIVISSTIVATVSCIMCLTASDTDDDDGLRERIVEVVVIEPDAIAIQIRDEFIEPSVIEQNAIQINNGLYENSNIPQATMVATVVPLRHC